MIIILFTHSKIKNEDASIKNNIMIKGDRFNIYDNDGNYTHYTEMRDNAYMSFFTEKGIWVYWATIEKNNDFFPVYNTNGDQVFLGRLVEKDEFELRTIDNVNRLYYSLRN